MSHLKITVCCLYRNNLLMINNYLKQNTQLDATINRKILLLCRTDTAQHVAAITMPIIRSPLNCRCSLRFPIIIKYSVFLLKIN